MYKTQKILLACLNSVLDGAPDFRDHEVVFAGITKKEFDDAYYSRYEGKWPVLQKDTHVLKAAVDSVLDGCDSFGLDEDIVRFKEVHYTVIECERVYRRMGFHRLINREGKFK